MTQEAQIKLLVIGGSAGSLSIVLKLIPYFNEGLTIPIILVFHRMQTEETILLDLLSSRATYKVKEIEDKDILHRIFHAGVPTFIDLLNEVHTIF